MARVLPLRASVSPCRGPSLEETFLRHYDRLFIYALYLTNNCPSQAEDLLHDAFVAAMLGQIDLASAHDAEKYLCGVLRHLHVSYVRRETRRSLVPLSALEYDSLSLALNARIEERAGFQEELELILRHACERKSVSKSASVLLLRFFLGFYPTEIARIIHASRRSVDHLLWLARKEIVRHLSVAERQSGAVLRPARRSPSAAIARYSWGHCPGLSGLRRLYESADCVAMPTEVLAHIVSCPKCLSLVCQLLGLHPPEDRFPTDTIAPDHSSSGGDREEHAPAPVAPSSRSLRARLDHAFREVFEHKPKEIRLVVNGFGLATHALTSGCSVFEVTGRTEERLSFIDVFSEQQVRLAFLAIQQPPEGDLEQWSVSKLSDGRFIRLSVRFTDIAPTIKVQYEDANWEPEPVLESIVDEAERAPASLAREARDTGALSLPGRRWWWLLLPWGPRRPLGYALGAVMLLVFGAAVVHRMMKPPTVSASMLIEKSTRLEVSLDVPKHLVAHRAFRIESWHTTSSRLIASGRVEIWENAAHLMKARRIFDEQNRLTSGEWSTPNGTTKFECGDCDEKADTTKSWATLPDALQDVVRHGPSAGDLARMIPDPTALTVQESANAYEIRYEKASAPGAGIVRALLLLSRSDLRAIQEIIAWRDTSGEIKEIRVIETRFERTPYELTPPTVFVPDKQLTKEARPVPRPNPKQGVLMQPPSLIGEPAPSRVELAATEIEARLALHKAAADLSEQIEIEPSSTRVELRGVLVSDARRQQILAALSGIPYVSARFRVVEETARHFAHIRRTTAFDAMRPTDAPLTHTLREHFPAPQKREQFVTEVLEASQEAYERAWALRRLALRYQPAEAARLSTTGNDELASMVRDHSESLNRAMCTLEKDLRPLLHANLPPSDAVPDARGLWQENALRTFDAVQRIHHLTVKLLTTSAWGTADCEPLELGWLQALSSSQWRTGERGLQPFSSVAVGTDQVRALVKTTDKTKEYTK
jgi:DNA-directed RNA polymerase specialized sigma24 family protein